MNATGAWDRLEPKLAATNARVAALESDPSRRNSFVAYTMERDSAYCDLDGERLLMMSGYSYLGLAGDERVVAAAKAAVDVYGTGNHGVRALAGTIPLHEELEAEVARFAHRERALVFGSGYAANVGTVGALVGQGDTVLIDKYDHASIVDGCRLSGATVTRFRHNDVEHLERRLKAASPTGVRLVIVDSVYSMDGDIAPLPELREVCDRYDACSWSTRPTPWASSARPAAASRSTSTTRSASTSNSAPSPRPSPPWAAGSPAATTSSATCATPPARSCSPPPLAPPDRRRPGVPADPAPRARARHPHPGPGRTPAQAPQRRRHLHHGLHHRRAARHRRLRRRRLRLRHRLPQGRRHRPARRHPRRAQRPGPAAHRGHRPPHRGRHRLRRRRVPDRRRPDRPDLRTAAPARRGEEAMAPPHRPPIAVTGLGVVSPPATPSASSGTPSPPGAPPPPPSPTRRWPATRYAWAAASATCPRTARCPPRTPAAWTPSPSTAPSPPSPPTTTPAAPNPGPGAARSWSATRSADAPPATASPRSTPGTARCGSPR
ncbi:7-keto-8-aminopelargonate synthetase [Kitasatospora sp. Ki12]